ncbi:MAG: branched-chain amino acid ABC transporter permease [Desulfuromonas sp.]|mgnify:CR=1 FL=1|nr:MAG: branched-chain amino acid ABC transporter permease [Desulfuromonas sp.]
MVQDIKKSFGIALWFIFLTFPFVVVKVNTLKDVVEWRWMNMLWVGIGSFALSFVWRWAMERKASQAKSDDAESDTQAASLTERLFSEPKVYRPLIIIAAVFFLVFPLLFNISQVNIMVLALIFVVLGLGLNINVGLAGMLDLGYVAFFAIGAYTYGILNSKFGVGFWPALPIGGLVATIFGILLGFPILRLRGDYLAIVTLGFATIAHVVILNGEGLFGGAKGIANISRPGFFGIEMGIDAVTTYIYYLMIALVVFTIFITNRLKDSRIGRAWMALREDEIACVAMGIDMARTKLSAYAFGAFWAGVVGVIFAARNTYLHPNSFTFMESAIVLSIVVLGGMGSIVGVIIAALVMILMPEYLRAVADYRMLAFGAVMVLMMIFRPQGLIANVRRSYEYNPDDSATEGGPS